MAGSGRKEDLDPTDKVHGEEHSEVHGGALEPPRCTAECHSGVPQQFLDEKEAEIYLFFSNFILFCLGETEL